MPQMSANGNCITAKHHSLGTYHLYCLPSPPPIDPADPGDIDDAGSVEPELIFTENNTNFHRLYGGQNQTRYVKDAFHDHIIPSHRPEDSDMFKTGIHLRRRTYENSSDEEEQGPRTPFPYGPTFVNPAQKGTKSGAHYVFKDVPRLHRDPLHSPSPPHPVPLSAPAILRFSCIRFFHLPGCYSYVIWFTTRSFLFSKDSFLPAQPRSFFDLPAQL